MVFESLLLLNPPHSRKGKSLLYFWDSVARIRAMHRYMGRLHFPPPLKLGMVM